MKHLGLHVTDTFVALALADVTSSRAHVLWSAALPRTEQDDIPALLATLLKDCPDTHVPCATTPPVHRIISFTLPLPSNAPRRDVARATVIQGARLAVGTPQDQQRTAFIRLYTTWYASLCDTNDLAAIRRDTTACTDLVCDDPALAWQRIRATIGTPQAILDLSAPTPVLFLFPDHAPPVTAPLNTTNLNRLIWRHINDARQTSLVDVHHLAVFGTHDEIDAVRTDLAQYEGITVTQAAIPDHEPSHLFAIALATWPAEPHLNFLASPQPFSRRTLLPYKRHIAAAIAAAALYTAFLTIHLLNMTTADAQVHTELSLLTPKLSTAKELVAHLSDLQALDTQTDTLHTRNLTLIDTLAELGARLPQHVWLSSIQETATGWALSGHSRGLNDDASIVAHLDFVADTETPTITNASGTPADLFQWTLAIGAEPAPSPAPLLRPTSTP